MPYTNSGSFGTSSAIKQWNPQTDPNFIESGVGKSISIILTADTITTIDNIPAGTRQGTIIYFNKETNLWSIASQSDEQQRNKGIFLNPTSLNSNLPAIDQVVGSYALVQSTNTYFLITNTSGSNLWVDTNSGVAPTSLQLSDIDTSLNNASTTRVAPTSSIKTLNDSKQPKTDNTLLTTDKTIVGAINENKVNIDSKANISDVYNKTETDDFLNQKVDKISGKGLSTEDYTAAEKSKLAGIAEEATKNQTDAYLLSRENHTGTQPASTISDFQAAVSLNQDVIDSKDAKHTHLNKALLDTYDQTNVDISDAISKKHTHTNKTILDNTTASYTTEDKTKLDGIDLNTKQNLIPRISSEALMLALQNLTVGYIVARTDVSALFQLKELPSNQLQNWEVLVSTGGSVSIPSTAVEKVYTSGALPTLNGYYAYNGGTMPAGSIGDILKLENTVWTVDQTFDNAPASIYSKLDGKTYNKKINASGVKTWAAAAEPAIYEARSDGDDTKIGGFTSVQGAVNAYTADRLAGLVSVGVINDYIANSNESVFIDTENVALIGFGTGTRSQNLISRLTLGPNSHRVTIKDILISAGSLVPLTIQSTGTTTESGGSTGRGKHILSGVSTSTTGTTAVEISSINNFISLENGSDFGNKVVNFANRTGSVQAIYVEGVKNVNLVIGSGYVVSKSNSYTAYISNISASSYLLDLDSAKPTAYSLIRTASALGIPTSVRIGTLIINDDVNGNLANLKCKTTYTVAANLGLGTAIDLTKYDIQTQINDSSVSLSTTYSSNKINTELATKENTITTLPIAKGGTNSSTALTNDKVMISENGKIIESSTTKTQLSYLDPTSSIQQQINSKEANIIKTNQAKKFVRINATEDGYTYEELIDPNTNLIKNSYISKDLKFDFLIVANETERFALTTAEVQKNDSVYQNDVNKLFYVIDEANLNNSNGYKEIAINVDVSNYFNKNTDTTDNITEGANNKFVSTTEKALIGEVKTKTIYVIPNNKSGSYTITAAELDNEVISLANQITTTTTFSLATPNDSTKSREIEIIVPSMGTAFITIAGYQVQVNSRVKFTWNGASWYAYDLYSKINKSDGNSLVLSYVLTGITTATTWAKLTTTNTIKQLADFSNLIYDRINLKADDSAVLHKTGNETATGVKTFQTINLSSVNNVSGYSTALVRTNTGEIAQQPLSSSGGTSFQEPLTIRSTGTVQPVKATVTQYDYILLNELGNNWCDISLHYSALSNAGANGGNGVLIFQLPTGYYFDLSFNQFDNNANNNISNYNRLHLILAGSSGIVSYNGSASTAAVVPQNNTYFKIVTLSALSGAGHNIWYYLSNTYYNINSSAMNIQVRFKCKYYK